ncbi:MAG: ClbS/DfsB family four-helix bundle protein [Candidatus Kariarchaeaceae archaeon]|jgi:hypothetical protein
MSYEEDKVKLIDNIHKSWRLLFTTLNKVPKNRWEEPGVLNKWSIKDILAHLHEWHNMLDLWHNIGIEGKTPETPLPGYKWNQLREVNEIIYQKYKNMGLAVVLKNLENTHERVLKLSHEVPAEAIFTKGYFKWTGNTYFRSYIRSNSSGHYNWAKKHIRKWMREQNII